MRSLATIFASLSVLIAPLASSADCDLFARSEKVQGFKALMDRSMQNKIEALGFKFYEHTVVLVASESSPLCAAVLIGHQIHIRQLPEPIAMSNSVYEFRNEWRPLTTSEKQVFLPNLPKESGQSMLIFNVDQTGKDPFSSTYGSSRFNFAFATHEAFHFLHQFNSSVHFEHCADGQACWGWSSESGKAFINQVCYRGTPEVRKLLLTEIQAIKAAYRSASTNDRQATIRFLKIFIEARTARYLELTNKTFQHSTWITAGSCEEAEANLEWTEGAATFVELSYLLKLKEITSEDILFSLETSSFSGDLFYSVGMLQLAVLEKMQPKFLASYLSRETPLDKLHFAALKTFIEKQ